MVVKRSELMMVRWFMLTVVLSFGALSGCGRSGKAPKTAAKVVGVSREKGEVTVPMGSDEKATLSAATGCDLLLVRFDTGRKERGVLSFPTLMTAHGKQCHERARTWKAEMGGTVEVWFEVPECQTQFIVNWEGKLYPINTSKPVR